VAVAKNIPSNKTQVRLIQCCGAASFYAAPGLNFDAAPAALAASAPAPTLLYGKAKFLKRTKV
jgi:hypothetical protein